MIADGCANHSEAPPANCVAPTPRALHSPAEPLELERAGLQRIQAGDFEGAADIFGRAASATPERHTSWNNLALALNGLDRHEDAVFALSRSLDLAPDQPATWLSLATSLLRLGRWEDADRACNDALALDGRSVDAWHLRALASNAIGDFSRAAECFAQMVTLGEGNAGIFTNLGVAAMRCGRFDQAVEALSSAAALDPADAAINEMLLTAQLARAAASGRAFHLPAAQADMDRTAKTAFLLLDAAGQRQAAARIAAAWVDRRPGNPEARHLLDAALSKPVPRQPAALVAQRFDEMADTFDETLQRQLGYDGPARLEALLTPHIPPAGQLDILDLGCGTGLCATVLRPLARRLEGVDLSAGMLAKARERGLYDDLAHDDLVDVLNGREARWDMVAVLDAFPYLGALETTFILAAAALRPGGWFVFSTERFEGTGYRLLGNGRYAHGADYIAGLAAPDFDLVNQASVTLRREAGRAVGGGYYLFRRKVAARR